jgi:hypothetical protein
MYSTTTTNKCNVLEVKKVLGLYRLTKNHDGRQKPEQRLYK